VAPTAMPHLSFRDSLAMFINAAFSVFMFLVFQFQDFGLLSFFFFGGFHPLGVNVNKTVPNFYARQRRFRRMSIGLNQIMFPS
jgi:hypothetical protein